MKDPLVSISLVSFNQAPYIRQAIESCLMQKVDFNYEIIIHDDASTDNSAEIILEYANEHPEIIRPIIQTENQFSKGTEVNAKIVIPKARGKYIARMDADDISLPERFEKQVAFLESNLSVGVLGTNYFSINETGQIINSYLLHGQPPRIWWRLFFVNQIVHPSVMMRRCIFSKYHIHYNELLTSSQDYDLWFQILPFFDLANLNEILFKYRIHEENISIGKKREQAKNAENILKYRIEQILNINIPHSYIPTILKIKEDKTIRETDKDKMIDIKNMLSDIMAV